jgi:hypothetical protein
MVRTEIKEIPTWHCFGQPLAEEAASPTLLPTLSFSDSSGLGPGSCRACASLARIAFALGFAFELADDGQHRRYGWPSGVVRSKGSVFIL